jgi:hypothetical protein
MDDRVTDRAPGPDPWGKVPPWEQPGGFRLDGEPHRGDLLSGLGNTALVAGFFAFALASLGLGLLCLPVALPLGLAVWAAARRDLARMGRGLMDPRGEDKTEEARLSGRAAMWLGLLGVVLALPLLLLGVRPWKW